MARYDSPEWLFHLLLQLSSAVGLLVLAMCLINGSGPVTAVMRSGAAFGTFAFLSWTASLVWQPLPPAAEVTEQSEAPARSPAPDTTGSATPAEIEE